MARRTTVVDCARRLSRDRRGASLTEYALMVALVIVACFLGYRTLGAKLAGTSGKSDTAFSATSRGQAGSGSGATQATETSGASARGGSASAKATGQPAREGSATTSGSEATEPSEGTGLWGIFGAAVGGFFVIGLYFVIRNAKRGAPS